MNRPRDQITWTENKDALLWILLISVFFGCSDEGIRVTLHHVSESSVTTGVPIEVQKLLWNDVAAEKEKLRVILEEGDKHPDWLADTYRRRICVAEKQPLYYTKYIEADGIAILGDSEVMNHEMLVAQDIVLRMTAKRPEIRHWLTPAWGYRVIIAALPPSGRGIPELDCYGVEIGCGRAELFFSVTDLMEACRWQTLVHEFAHSIQGTISCYDRRIRWKTGNCFYDAPLPLETANFHQRLDTAYAQAIENRTWKDRYAETNVREYWAEGVTWWFYDIGAGREFGRLRCARSFTRRVAR